MISYLMFPHWIGETHEVSATNEAEGHSAARGFFGTPRRLARSTGDGANWNAVFSAGANGLFAIDTICSFANVGHLHVQQHATDSWSAPSVNTEVSHVRETLPAAGLTLSGCTLTRSAGAWTPHTLKGARLRFATGGTVHTIDDNTAAKLYCDGEDISSGSGDAQILSRRKWQGIAQNQYKFLRVLIENQQTVENFYEWGLQVGLRTEFTGLTSLRQTDISISTDGVTPGGHVYRVMTGGARALTRRQWAFSAYMMALAKFQELRAQIVTQGRAPFVLIPDASNPYDWAYVHAEGSIEWIAKTTTIRLNEVV